MPNLFGKIVNRFFKKEIKENKVPEYENFVRRNDKLDEIKKVLFLPRRVIIVIEGREGVGKSIFLRTLVKDLINDHFVVFRIINRKNVEIESVLYELVYKLKEDIKIFPHWKVKKEKVIEVTEFILDWIKPFMGLLGKLPLEKLPSHLAGIEKEKIDRDFVNHLKDVLNNLIKYMPFDKKMVLILDQVERIDQKELNLLYDIMEGLPERASFVLASDRQFLTSEILSKTNIDFISIENFTKIETEEMLKLNGISYDEIFLNKFYDKYKGDPLLQAKALDELKSKKNFDLDSLPQNLEKLFQYYLNEIPAEDMQIIWTLCLFRECLKTDTLCDITKNDLKSILEIFKKKEILKVVKVNHCYAPFNSLFSEYVCNMLDKTTETEFERIHSFAAEYYIDKLKNPVNRSPNEILFAMIEATYHASKTKSPHIMQRIITIWSSNEGFVKNSFQIKNGMYKISNDIGIFFQKWGKPEESIKYFENALELIEKIKYTGGKEIILNNIGFAYLDCGNSDKANEYFQKAQQIKTQTKIEPRKFERPKFN